MEELERKILSLELELKNFLESHKVCDWITSRMHFSQTIDRIQTQLKEHETDIEELKKCLNDYHVSLKVLEIKIITIATIGTTILITLLNKVLPLIIPTLPK